MPCPPLAKELACDRRHDFAPRIVIRRFLTTLLVLCCCATAGAQLPSLPHINAQLTDTDLQTGDQVLTGNARLDYEGLLLTADEIRYNIAKQTVTARNHVVLTIDNNLTLTSEKGRDILPKGSKRLLADEITILLKDKTFTGTRLRFGEYPLFIEASRVEGSKQDVTLFDAKMFYREPSPFSPVLTAEKISIVNREKVRADNAHLGTGDTPVIPFRRSATAAPSATTPISAFTCPFHKASTSAATSASIPHAASSSALQAPTTQPSTSATASANSTPATSTTTAIRAPTSSDAPSTPTGASSSGKAHAPRLTIKTRPSRSSTTGPTPPWREISA